MLYIIGLVIIGYILYKKYKPMFVFSDYKKFFNSLETIHDEWHESTIEKINFKIKKIDIISNDDVNTIINNLLSYTESDTNYMITETTKENIINYNVILKKESNLFSIDMILSYNKDTNDNAIFYIPNESYVKFNINKIYWHKHSFSYINDSDIEVTSFIYFRIGENDFIEIPLIIKAKVYPNDLINKNGILTYSLEKVI